MRAAALGDLHLGRELYGYDLTPAIKRAMQRFLRYCIREQVGVAIQLGDVFDRPTPSEASRKLFVQWLNEFERVGIKLYVLTGNHDVTGKRGARSALESIRCMQWKHVRVVDRPLLVPGMLFLPFPSPSLYDDTSEWVDEVLEVSEGMPDDTIICCHLNIEGARLGAQEWQYRGEDFVLPAGLIQQAKVVLAGHIHKPQFIPPKTCPPRVFVVGAAERLRFDEAGEPRCFAVWNPDMGGAGVMRLRCLPLGTIELDASGASHGGEPPSTTELLDSISHHDVRGAVIKIVPFVDDSSFVRWREVEEALYGAGAEHVVIAPAVRVAVREKAKRATQHATEDPDRVKEFLRARVSDKQERQALWRMFHELKERVSHE